MHQFIFTPGEWLGMGTLKLPIFKEPIRYYTKWKISELKNGEIVCEQLLETEGSNEPLLNYIQVAPKSGKEFAIRLQNALLGNMSGHGEVDDEHITWWFAKRIAEDGAEGLEGKEVYTLQPDGTYQLHAEYKFEGLVHTNVEGRLWKKE